MIKIDSNLTYEIIFIHHLMWCYFVIALDVLVFLSKAIYLNWVGFLQRAMIHNWKIIIGDSKTLQLNIKHF